MSDPEVRPPRRPLQERSESQRNTLAIRVVPYSPPRPDALQTPQSGGAPSRPASTIAAQASGDDRTDASSTRTRKHAAEREGHASNPGSALSSSSSSLIPLARAKEDGVSGAKLASDERTISPTPALSSPPYSPTSPNITAVNASSQPSLQHLEEPTAPASASSWQRPLSRRRNLITVHSDKTFSLLPLSDRGSGSRYTPVSSPTASSHERVSSDAVSDDRPSSPLTTLPDRSLSPYTPVSSSTHLADDPITATASPWNYRMLGGLRKVPKTPDLKQKALYSASSPDSFLPPLPEAAAIGQSTRHLANKASFQSSQSASTTSETTNYKVYGSSSPVLPALPSTFSEPPSSSHSNYQLLGESSSPAPNYQIVGQTSSPTPSLDPRPQTSDSDENYIVHGDPSPSTSSLVRAKKQLRPEYSQESLIIPPLRPTKKPSWEQFGYLTKRSRESLRTGSLKSISSVLSQETAQAFFASSASIYLQGGPSGLPGRRQDTWAGSSSSLVPSRSPMQAHQHQWSSQLSTVVSESEGGSEPGTRSVSMMSSVPGRRSSGFGSTHSRQMLSISSSLAAEERGQSQSYSHSRSHSRTDSLDTPQHLHPQPAYPQPTYPRAAYRDAGSGPSRLIRDQDEHGDGLADLHELQTRPSRTRLSGLFFSNLSDRNLHSSSSSHANSFNSSSLPAWARLYYGSGERKLLAMPSDTNLSDYYNSPSSSFRSGSPSVDHLPLNIHSQRRRPREVNPNLRAMSSSGSMDITPLPAHYFSAGLRKKTSSVWSPHLRNDKRASRYSIWEPPSVNWSAETGMFGRRNVQVVSFIVGFICPLVWMAAAFLPLPPNPRDEIAERGQGSSEFDVRRKLGARRNAIDETQYDSARWWRTLNRYMAVLGLLVTGAVVALVVLGVKQGWGSQGSA